MLPTTSGTMYVSSSFSPSVSLSLLRLPLHPRPLYISLYPPLFVLLSLSLSFTSSTFFLSLHPLYILPSPLPLPCSPLFLPPSPSLSPSFSPSVLFISLPSLSPFPLFCPSPSPPLPTPPYPYPCYDSSSISVDLISRLSYSCTCRMELRCVIAVIRHADRTPKQKMKMEVKHPR